MKKSQIIEQLQELLETNMQELINAKKEIEYLREEKSNYIELYRWFEKKSEKYENMSVFQFIKHKYVSKTK